MDLDKGLDSGIFGSTFWLKRNDDDDAKVLTFLDGTNDTCIDGGSDLIVNVSGISEGTDKVLILNVDETLRVLNEINVGIVNGSFDTRNAATP